MARIRSIKPEFWASEALGTRLRGPDGRQARLLFIALWNHAEDHGVCRASPALVRAAAFPYDEDVTSTDVSRWLGMLEAGGFIVRYERNGSSYLWIRAFDEHQRIDRKSKTTLPEPSEDERERRASPRASPNSPESETVDPCASPRRALDEPSLQEGKGREGKGEEGISASQGAADAGQQPGERPPLTLTTQDANPQPKQRAPRKPSAAEELYQQVQEVRRQQCEKAGVPFTPDYMPEARQNKDLGPVVRVPPGAEVDAEGRTEAFRRFSAAFAEYLSDDFHRAKGWPLALFLTGTVRARYEQAAALAAQSTMAEVGT